MNYPSVYGRGSWLNLSNPPLLDSSGYASSSEKTTSHKDDVFYNVVTFLSALKLMCILYP